MNELINESILFEVFGTTPDILKILLQMIQDTKNDLDQAAIESINQQSVS